jgi:hypothetical protein
MMRDVQDGELPAAGAPSEKDRGRTLPKFQIPKFLKLGLRLSKWLVIAGLVGVLLFLSALFLVVRHFDFETFLNYFALGLLFFVLITLFYGIIAIHDIPYEIAKHRDHPHQDAIHAAGWVSLFTLHALWPFLWIWAMLYRPERGWGLDHKASPGPTHYNGYEDLDRRLAELERRSENGGH